MAYINYNFESCTEAFYILVDIEGDTYLKESERRTIGTAYCDLLSADYSRLFIPDNIDGLASRRSLQNYPKRQYTDEEQKIIRKIIEVARDVVPERPDPVNGSVSWMQESEYGFLQMVREISGMVTLHLEFWKWAKDQRQKERIRFFEYLQDTTFDRILKNDSYIVNKQFVSRKSKAQTIQELYSRFIRVVKNGEKLIWVSNYRKFLNYSIDEFITKGLILKRCENCGKYFIPTSRTDEIYCDRISPQEDTMTCKEYGSKKLWYSKIKNNPSLKMARNIYSAKQMLAKRNPDIEKYRIMFEFFASERRKWEIDVKAGIKTEDEYIAWLKDMKEKKVLSNGDNKEA